MKHIWVELKTVVKPLLFFPFVFFVLFSCSSSDKSSDTNVTTGHEPIYLIGTSTFGAEGSNAYLTLVPKLELNGDLVNIDKSREFPGLSDMVVYEGEVFVASGDAPSITKYKVLDDLSLVKQETVSFVAFGLSSAAFWNNQFISKTKAYMVNGSGEIVIWNPQTMETLGQIPLPKPVAREGLNFVSGLADRSGITYGGKFYLPMYWTDKSYGARSSDSLVIVVDIATDSVVKTISAPCPGLDYATLDSDTGKLHFSNWTGGAGAFFVLHSAETCIATLDLQTDAVTTKTFASLTKGRQGAAFRYAGNGQFLMSVFDGVRAHADSAKDPAEIVATPNWQLWTYNSVNQEAAPVTNIDWNSGAIIHQVVDGKLYSLVPGEAYANTVAYAEHQAGAAEPAFRITGWSFRLFRVR